MGRGSLTLRLPAGEPRLSDTPPARAGSAPRAGFLRLAAAAGLLALVLIGTGPAGAAAVQAGGDADGRVEEARRLRDRGNLREAADRLRAFLEDHPDDASALRLLAAVLERSGDAEGSLEALERALRVRPGDPLLRLDYGRMLVNRSRIDPARETLRPVADDGGVPPRIRADAHVQLGRAALRTGEADRAEELLRRALDLEARHDEALRLLRALHRDRSSSIRTTGSITDDDQPLDRAGAEVRGEWRTRPWLSARARVATERVSAPAFAETLDRATVGARARWERLDVAAVGWGGGYRRSSVGRPEWTAGGAVEITGPEAVGVRLETGRRPYLLTAASLDESLDVWSLGGVVERPATDGWSGLLSYREDRFDDDNRVRETILRLRVPATTTPAGRVRVGYRFHAADAVENTFVPLELPDQEASGRIAGRYDPIYTPEALYSHSFLLDLTYGREGGIRLTGEAGWGFHAREERPVLFPAVPGAPDAGTDRQFRRRSFTPWHLAGRLEVPVLPAMVVELRGGYETSAFRTRSFASVGWAYYLIPAGLR